jgi:predicted 2-oxoglutarate/Fe(II)-dependent dioxygenase YbiX
MAESLLQALTARAEDTSTAAGSASATADTATVYTGWSRKWQRAVDVGSPGTFNEEFASWEATMDPVLHRALVEDQMDVDDEALVRLLGCEKLVQTRAIVERRGAIRQAGCAALRAAVDAERDVTQDSVDRKAQHQLNISIERLTECIGREDVRGLWRLADELLAVQRAEAAERAAASGTAVTQHTAEKVEAADGGFYVDVFVRRYTRETRPWIAFHHDVSTVTINVALSDDADHEGGRLHAIVDARHRILTRREGEATTHGDDVMHAVSAMRRGTRYSLIVFFYSLSNNEESLEWQTVPKREVGAAWDAVADAHSLAAAAGAAIT